MRRFIIRGPKSRRIADRLAYAKFVAERLIHAPRMQAKRGKLAIAEK